MSGPLLLILSLFFFDLKLKELSPLVSNGLVFLPALSQASQLFLSGLGHRLKLSDLFRAGLSFFLRGCAQVLDLLRILLLERVVVALCLREGFLEFREFFCVLSLAIFVLGSGLLILCDIVGALALLLKELLALLLDALIQILDLLLKLRLDVLDRLEVVFLLVLDLGGKLFLFALSLI